MIGIYNEDATDGSCGTKGYEEDTKVLGKASETFSKRKVYNHKAKDVQKCFCFHKAIKGQIAGPRNNRNATDEETSENLKTPLRC